MIYFKKTIISLPQPLRWFLLKLIYLGQTFAWRIKGKPAPAPHPIKIQVILKYAQRLKINSLIETGTYLGETVLATKGYFQKIYSIELGRDLYTLARKTFRGDRNIEIIYGDSAKVLPEIIKKINKPYVFWLDAHYSGGITSKSLKETPIMQELKSILKNKIRNHVILIDDARFFTGDNDYPTFKEVKTFVKEFLPKHKINIENDIIMIIPKI